MHVRIFFLLLFLLFLFSSSFFFFLSNFLFICSVLANYNFFNVLLSRLKRGVKVFVVTILDRKVEFGERFGYGITHIFCFLKSNYVIRDRIFLLRNLSYGVECREGNIHVFSKVWSEHDWLNCNSKSVPQFYLSCRQPLRHRVLSFYTHGATDI